MKRERGKGGRKWEIEKGMEGKGERERNREKLERWPIEEGEENTRKCVKSGKGKRQMKRPMKRIE